MSNFASPVFCDWITIRQVHPFDVPVMNNGCVVSFESGALAKAMTVDEETGQVMLLPAFDASKAIYTTNKRIEHEGSYETALQVRSDGRLVELSGNVSRFGRPDNLFGLTVAQCVDKANEIIKTLGLPPFTENCPQVPMARTDTYNSPVYNARISRLDLTQNYFTGSRENALKYVHTMTGQANKRLGGAQPKHYGNGVTWNEGSKRWYSKLYYKADSLGKYASPEIYEFCERLGIVRYEASIKARELADLGLNRINPWRGKDGEMEKVIYGKFSQVLNRSSVNTFELNDIPGKLGLIARDYINGGNPFLNSGTKRTAQRWRKGLLAFGIDISVPLNVTRLSARVKVIEVSPLACPDWYRMVA